MLFHGGNLISTSLDRDTIDRQESENFNFMKIFRYRHVQIAILLTVAKLAMQLYEGNLMSTCLDRDTVDRQKNET